MADKDPNCVSAEQSSEDARWRDLMRVLLVSAFRRPRAEWPALFVLAESQASAERKAQIQQMIGELEPTFVDQAMERVNVEDIKDANLATLRQMLKTMLRYKFGHKLGGLPAKLQTQIDTADDAEQMRQAIRRVPECASLADFHL
jgi:hypothetical protein